MTEITVLPKDEVKIIGCDPLSYKGVHAFLCDNFLSLSISDRSDFSSQAKASFTFYCMNSFFLMAAIRDSKRHKLFFEFSGEYLGHMDEYSGYLAVSEGRNIHPVEKLSLEISFSSSCTFEFYLSGSVGAIFPWCCSNPNNLNSKYAYEIYFSLSENETKSIIEKAKNSATNITESDIWKKFNL
jgi:hypothetical protein